MAGAHRRSRAWASEDDQFHGRIDDVFLRIAPLRRQPGRATQSLVSSSAKACSVGPDSRQLPSREPTPGVEVRHRHDVVGPGVLRRVAEPLGREPRVRRDPRDSRTRRSPVACRRTSRSPRRPCCRSCATPCRSSATTGCRGRGRSRTPPARSRRPGRCRGGPGRRSSAAGRGRWSPAVRARRARPIARRCMAT